VIRQWPRITEKTLSDDSTRVHRVATPEVHADRNVVDVSYTVEVTDLDTRQTELLRETHSMRYLFTPEIELLLEIAGMKLLESRAWMSDDSPGFESWGAAFIAKG
ncbi:MAG TPA: hypothetical protein VHM24_11375, partial [Gemmatimonadaceae bacterium]|nr:hypothetical protein [Gemmatimonadaceae bacterium]